VGSRRKVIEMKFLPLLRRSCLAAVVLFVFSAAAPSGPPPKPQGPDHSLNGLFVALSKARSEDEAKPIEQQIEELRAIPTRRRSCSIP